MTYQMAKVKDKSARVSKEMVKKQKKQNEESFQCRLKGNLQLTPLYPVKTACVCFLW